MMRGNEKTTMQPRMLRRALDFIRDNAQYDISIRDIASAADVTPRAIQYAFREHLNTTPLEYLRRVRLERAHQELKSADPA
ncbi:AraC family transcriptional regulator, partial [Mycobacterium sp. ITM-2017-0098]